MKFFKKSLFLFVLAWSTTCTPMTVSDDHKQNIISILKIIGNAIKDELSFINNTSLTNDDDNEWVFNDQVNWIEVGKIIQQKLPVITRKVSNAVKYDLTPDQRVIVIDFLRSIKPVFSFTPADIFKMGEEKESEDALERCAPGLAEKLENLDTLTLEEKILLVKKLKEIDTLSESFKLSTEFYCFASHIDSLDIITDVVKGVDLGDDKPALRLRKCCICLVMSLAILFTCHNGDCFGPEEIWITLFTDTIPNLFTVVNLLSNSLLESIGI